MTRPVVFVLKGYPRLSETFVAEEIRALEAAGLPLRIVALRRPTDRKVHPVHREVVAPVAYLPEYLHREPLRVLRAWMRQRRRPSYRVLRRAFFRDLRRDPSRNRVRRFGQALVLADELPGDVGQIHAHFIHTPASVVSYASLVTGLPWSCSAHAKDIWTSPDWELSEKLAAARWTVTCTRAGRDRLADLSPPGKEVRLVYHGVRLDRFVPLPSFGSSRDGGSAADPVRILCVSRAVPKKGLDVLLRALADLPPDLHWRLVHLGGGPDLPQLRTLAGTLGLGERVDWLGPQDQTAVLDGYRQADVFALPCRVTDDGDRDGLPNVLVEAQSQGLACVSTTAGGVPELIEHGRNGLLVPPDDPAALGKALATLIRDPAMRRRLGREGERRVRRDFDGRTAAATLAALFREGAEPACDLAAE
ncbi:MAG: glycosyltransferase family 4 protein [Parafilimonas terrae]|nr:glycosyltransferase family 4 protein [Parafilimonas terrae]